MSIKSQLKVIIIGCGRIINKHIEAISVLDQIEIVGFVDVDFKKAENCSKKYGGKAFETYKNIKIETIANLAVVLTDSGSHYQCTIDLLNYGLDVLVEKPMALKLQHARNMISTAKKLNRNLFVVKQNRFNTAVQKVKEIINQGKLGTLNSANVCVRWCRDQKYYAQSEWRGTWANDGGVITNQASHHLDLLLWFMGDIECVSAFEANLMSEIEAEDTLFGIIKFKSGALGIIEATTAARPKNIEGSLAFLGSKGSAKIGGIAVNEISHLVVEDSEAISDEPKITSNSTNDVYGSGHQAIYSEIVKFYSDEKNAAISGEEGLKSLNLIHMLYKSVEENRTIFSKEKTKESKRLGVGQIEKI